MARMKESKFGLYSLHWSSYWALSTKELRQVLVCTFAGVHKTIHFTKLFDKVFNHYPFPSLHDIDNKSYYSSTMSWMRSGT